MVKDVCFNATMANSDRYSSPVPLVGLYIAAASVVCALLVLFDLWAGFRWKKYWFPCRFYSINSITLTLISIAAKLPVDLTTDMPSKQDQLSKLCGTVFICVSMAFMLPSIAKNAEFESYANVTALSIFVITVVVNICIQMATGVIFSFKAEHVIILICMLLLLLRFWFSVTSINVLKRYRADKGPELIREGEGNMLARLRLCFIYSYHSCLQLYACTRIFFTDVYIVCMICSTVLVQAMLRSFISKGLRFCEGRSDYGWSMWLVVGNQIFTVAVVTFAIGGRWLNQAFHSGSTGSDAGNHMTYLQFQFLFSLGNLPRFLERAFKFVIYLPLFGINAVLLGLTVMVKIFVSPLIVCGGFLCPSSSLGMNEVNEKSEHFKKKLRSHLVNANNDWVMKKGVVDLERWIAISEQGSLNHLTRLLSTVSRSRESSYGVGMMGKGIQLQEFHVSVQFHVSVLSVMLLVEIAKAVIMPTTKDKIFIADVLDEVFDIIHFIEDKVNIGNANYRDLFTLAKVIHEYGLSAGLGDFVLEQNRDLERNLVNFEFSQKHDFHIGEDDLFLYMFTTMFYLNALISYRPDESSEVVYGRIEQLFVDLLHAFLAQLPLAVYTHILEGPVEEYDDRVRLGLGFMCKLQSIQSLISFSIPSGANITSLFDAQTSPINTQEQGTAEVQGVSTLSSNIAQTVVDVGEIQEDAQVTVQQV